ncbi:MAG: hypothetical protein AAFY41_04465 [Bacteroidota bacterium]
MKNIFIGLMLLSGTLVQAQNTFKTRVVDAEANEPLLGATIKINPHRKPKPEWYQH